MYETLQRPLEVTPQAPPQPISAAVARLLAAEERKEERRRLQIANARGAKRARGEVSPLIEEAPAKRVKTDDDGDDVAMPDTEGELIGEQEGPGKDVHVQNGENTTIEEEREVYMKPLQEVRGHTAYLTFACLRPSFPPPGPPPQTPTVDAEAELVCPSVDMAGAAVDTGQPCDELPASNIAETADDGILTI